ncbi:phosphoribosylaminoimidazolesuccinocarboxamide synthase [Gemmatimonas sp.]|jgi:phosphoribosylaminoimidazole-succinocarboxamide synthase|uniref:phosphoribosylaminoimidazolesuccinocarboxamide synthase n=1 Tax=Gemmatimonas sp. TaxID=1962908 RepID=UPI00391D27D5
MTATALVETHLPLPLLRRGKVRDVYEVDAERLLLVTTDRISAFDVVMNEAIPYKGAVLTQLTAWWLAQLTETIAHHLITADTDAIIREVPELAPYREALAGRSMLTLRADVVPIECVIRGYITGSAWKEYQTSGTLAGEALAPALRESDRLLPPIFSPATKAETGHDENITIATVIERVGAETAATLERLARTIYEFGRDVAAPRGIIVADTKFEFGWRDGSLLLIDEVLTPDSSRFWPADGYAPGRGQPSFDKQPLRDWLDAERRAGRWNGDAPAPTLPPEVIRATSLRYRDAFARLTGAPLDLVALGLAADS